MREDWHLSMFLVSSCTVKTERQPIWRCKVDSLIEIQLDKGKNLSDQEERGRLGCDRTP